MNQCSKCGKQNKINYNYCYKCGTKLRDPFIENKSINRKRIRKTKTQTIKEFKVKSVKKDFKVNNFITLKLENSKTVIYIKGKRFTQCKYLLLEIPLNNLEKFEEINSIDEISDKLDHTLESGKNSQKIPIEVEFWGHCSNLEAWAEHGYDTRLLHSNLAFPLLKKLTDVGDPNAKSVFKEEIAKRMDSGQKSVVTYLISENYLNYLNSEELEFVLIKLKNDIAVDFKKKYCKILDVIDLNALLDLLLENIRESKILKLKQFGEINPNDKEIQSGFMIQNNKIIKIKLVNYDLVSIPESIGFLEKLENLDLSHNRIKTIPESIGLLKNLKKLKLSINQIQNIPETIGNLTSLRIIKLDHNQLTKLPDSIKNLNSLEFLSLWSNHLVALPEGIGDLKSLQVIGLSFNDLITIPVSITKLKLIQTLDLSNNHLTKIPEKIGELKSLQILWLNDNYLEALPISILSIKYLKQLYLFSNPCVIHPDTEMRYLLDKLQQNDVNVK